MTFIGREKQLTILSNVLDNAINFNVVVVHGPSSSGKSLVLNHVLQEKHIHHVYVSCRCIATVKQFFDVLLNGIHNKFQSNALTNKENHRAPIPQSTFPCNEYLGWRTYSIHKQCNTAATFAHILQNEDFSAKHSFYIVLDHFERLYHLQTNLICSLLQITDSEPLFKATESKIGFILVDNSSAMVNIKRILGSKHTIALPVYFDQYSNKELQRILLHTTQPLFADTKLNATQRKSIINLLVHTFHIESRQIHRFHQYLALLMPDFIRISRDNNDHNPFKALILPLYETVSKSQQLAIDYTSKQIQSQPSEAIKDPDLPYVSKLLLLSAYLASFNSHKWNEYQFADVHKKRTKRKKRTAALKNEYTLRQKGPQSFTFRNLSGIFIELFKREAPAEFNKDLKYIQDIHSQMAHLISLSFISIVSRDGALDDTKFKCNIDHDFAAFIAKKIRIQKWENNLEAMAVGR
eukprot:225109_1